MKCQDWELSPALKGSMMSVIFIGVFFGNLVLRLNILSLAWNPLRSVDQQLTLTAGVRPCCWPMPGTEPFKVCVWMLWNFL